MLKINRKIEYALIAIKHMRHAYPGQLISAKDICDTYKTPFDTTSRVLQIMVQHGIVQAEHGAHGGYQIVKDLSKISLLELVNMIEGPVEIANCFHGNYSHCELTADCNVISPMLNLNARMSELFKTITIRELIESRHSGDKAIREKQIAQSSSKN